MRKPATAKLLCVCVCVCVCVCQVSIRCKQLFDEFWHEEELINVQFRVTQMVCIVIRFSE